MDNSIIERFIRKQKVAFICSVDEEGFPNVKAKRLWNTVAAPYGPKVVSIEDYETVLTFSTEIG
jgi:hypothetical protein